MLRGKVERVLDARTVRVAVESFSVAPRLKIRVRRVRAHLAHVPSGSRSLVEGKEVLLRPIAKVSKRKAHLALPLVETGASTA